MVRIETDRSFVVADIPGLIEGAARGAGLGIQFLRHLQRTRLLVHVVEVAESGAAMPPEEAVRTIDSELRTYSDGLSARPRWLALNKLDLLPRDQWDDAVDSLVKASDWNGPRVRNQRGDGRRRRGVGPFGNGLSGAGIGSCVKTASCVDMASK